MIFGEDSDIVENDFLTMQRFLPDVSRFLYSWGLAVMDLQNQFTVTPVLSRPIFNRHLLLSGHLSTDLHLAVRVTFSDVPTTYFSLFSPLLSTKVMIS